MALGAVSNIFRVPELRARLGYTIALLAIYRLGIFVSTPGIDRAALNAWMEEQTKSGGLLNLFNLFSGGAAGQMSIFALGIMPYVSASIIMQLLAVVVPSLERLQKEGGVGRQKLNQYTRYFTIVLAVLNGAGVARFVASQGRGAGAGDGAVTQIIVQDPSAWFYFMTIVSLTAGTAFIMWLGERITENGLGNGTSLIIFAGIVAGLVPSVERMVVQVQADSDKLPVYVLLLPFMLLVIGIVVYIERGMRRVPIQYAKRVSGRQMFAGQSSYFPMKVNSSGVIPPIFASAVLAFPATLAAWLPMVSSLDRLINQDLWVRDGIFVALIVGFAYFYTSLTFRADDVADNIKKQGGYIPGIRPGAQTAEYIKRVLNRLTFGGAIYLATVCIIPTVLFNLFNVPFQFGGTGLLIVVGVALDTVNQIEQHLITRNYEGFAGARGPRIRGRLRPAA